MEDEGSIALSIVRARPGARAERGLYSRFNALKNLWGCSVLIIRIYIL